MKSRSQSVVAEFESSIAHLHFELLLSAAYRDGFPLSPLIPVHVQPSYSEMDNTVFWMRKSTRIGRLIVQYASWLGAAPVKWDPVQNRMVYCPSDRVGSGNGARLRWKVALV